MKLSAKQFGYLSRAPRSDAAHRHPPSPPHKAMWNKMVKLGLLERSPNGQAYRLTPDGEEAMARFPDTLAEATRRTLVDAIERPRETRTDAPGFQTLVDAQLVYYASGNRFVVIDRARKIAADRGWLTAPGARLSPELRHEIALAGPGMPSDVTIEQVECLYFYDQALIVLARVNGDLHYGHIAEMNDHDEVWMYVPVTDTDAAAIRANEAALRNVLAEASQVLVIRKENDGSPGLAWSITGADLPEKWLPKADVTLAPKPEDLSFSPS